MRNVSYLLNYLSKITNQVSTFIVLACRPHNLIFYADQQVNKIQRIIRHVCEGILIVAEPSPDEHQFSGEYAVRKDSKAFWIDCELQALPSLNDPLQPMLLKHCACWTFSMDRPQQDKIAALHIPGTRKLAPNDEVSSWNVGALVVT